jgi:hypothetical protein
MGIVFGKEGLHFADTRAISGGRSIGLRDIERG